MPPKIGITVTAHEDYAGRKIRDDYWLALLEAGGLPLLLPPLPEELAPAVAASIDGLLLSGGGDFDPPCFGEAPLLPPKELDKERDAFELALIHECWRLNKPMLGICRGMQALNIALGGTIFQDLEMQKNDVIPHDQAAARQETSHQVRITNQGLISLFGRELAVNSHHHQAVAIIAPVLEAAAYAPDGVIEAIVACDSRHYAMGLQWHPEALRPFSPLFADFVQAAQG